MSAFFSGLMRRRQPIEAQSAINAAEHMLSAGSTGLTELAEALMPERRPA